MASGSACICPALPVVLTILLGRAKDTAERLVRKIKGRDRSDGREGIGQRM